MYWFVIVLSGLPVVVGIGLVVAGVLTHRDLVRDEHDDGDWSDVFAAARRRGRWAAASALAGWLLGTAVGIRSVVGESWWVDLTPLAGAAVAIALTGAPTRTERRARAAAGTASDLRRRGVTTFARAVPLGLALASTAALAVTVVAAGSQSSPDDQGRYTQLSMDVGDGSVSTTFFGWWFGVPVLVGALLLGLLVLIVLARVAGTPVTASRGADEALRRQRVATVLRVATGPVLIVLGTAWRSIGASSSLRTEIPRTGAGTIEFGTSFAALGTALDVAGTVTAGVGLALLLAVLLRRRPRTVPRTASTLDIAGECSSSECSRTEHSGTERSATE